jgi:hypothetical protein
VTALLWICSVPLIAEFAVAPFNLWSGRTIANFQRFTSLPARTATGALAPVKLAGAGLLAIGLAVPPAGVAGAAVIVLVSGFYLVRLAGRERHHADGIVAFGVSLALALAVLGLQLTR